MVQRRSISNKYLLARRRSSSCATRVGMRSPTYSTMVSPFAIGAVANRPSPVLARPTRTDLSFRAAIRALSLSLALHGAAFRPGAVLLFRAQFARALSAPPPAARALAPRLADHVAQVIVAVVVGEFFTRLDRAEREDEHAAVADRRVGVRIAGVVEVTRDVAARLAVDGPPAVDLGQRGVAGRSPLPPLFPAEPRTFVFGEPHAAPDWFGRKQAEASARAAETKGARRHTIRLKRE